MTQIYVTFDPKSESGSNITGIYTSQRYIKTAHFIPITQQEHDRYRADPNRYRVEEERLVEIKRNIEHVRLSQLSHRRIDARSRLLEPIVLEGREYTPDLPFQTNLAIAIHAAGSNEKIRPKFWCKIDGEWVMREHELAELLKISVELNSRREQISEDLYRSL